MASVHVADVCSKTGKVLKQHIHPLTLYVTLESANGALSKRKWKDHRLAISVADDTSDASSHPLLLCTTDSIAIGARVKVELHMADAPSFLFVRWYASSYSKEDGVWAQEMVAGGTGTSHIRLNDITGETVGQLKVEGFPRPASLLTPHPINKNAQALITQTQQSFKKLQYFIEKKDAFSMIHVHLDRLTDLPPLWFPLQATLMRAPTLPAIAVFEHWIRVARALSLSASPTYPELLADVLSLPSLGWVYRPDQLLNGQETDHWSSIWSAPDAALQAFDCEDGTKAILEIYHVLCSLSLSPATASADLMRLQRMAICYTAHVAIGELRCNGSDDEGGSAKPKQGVWPSAKARAPTYIMHCYLMLLPRTTVEQLPSLTIESTAYASGAWTRTAENTYAADSITYEKRHACMSDWSDAQQELAQIRMPMSMVKHDGMYGALVALLSVDPSGYAEHRLMNRINTATFLLNPLARVPGEVTAIKMLTSELKQIFRRELAMSPGSVFPLPPPSPASADRALSAIRMEQRPAGGFILVPGGHTLPLTSSLVIDVHT